MDLKDLSKLRIERSAQAPRKKRPWGRIVLIGIALVAAVAFGVSRFAAPLPVETVTVSTVYPSQNFTLINATGYVVPQRKAALSSKATGRLEWLGVLEGSRVKAGEVIARLESNDVQATLAQAQAQVNVAIANQQQGAAELRDAEANYKRSAELLSKKFISGAQHDSDVARLGKARAAIASQKAAVASAEANRRSAEVGVEQTLIRAPFDAIVLTKNANVGDNITPFSSAAEAKGAVVTVADMETLEVEADVAESSIGRITVDQPCEVQLDALPDTRLAAVVSRIVPTVDRSKATVLVKVRFIESNPKVLPDMSAKVAFLSRETKENEKRPVTAVQPGAIVERDGRKVVFTLKDDRAAAMPVTTGGKIGDLVEVKGVKAGERLIVNPADKIKDGTAVAPVKK
ncbi:MAG TPA: efflux RND transporter periplasmic adaptor subunit [Burkholderiales bacterium]|nr:efflux RND transporter periplasmic adaptor subunit [Burkholderiales bacterium]